MIWDGMLIVLVGVWIFVGVLLCIYIVLRIGTFFGGGDL